MSNTYFRLHPRSLDKFTTGDGERRDLLKSMTDLYTEEYKELVLAKLTPILHKKQFIREDNLVGRGRDKAVIKLDEEHVVKIPIENNESDVSILRQNHNINAELRLQIAEKKDPIPLYIERLIAIDPNSGIQIAKIIPGRTLSSLFKSNTPVNIEELFLEIEKISKKLFELGIMVDPNVGNILLSNDGTLSGLIDLRLKLEVEYTAQIISERINNSIREHIINYSM